MEALEALLWWRRAVRRLLPPGRRHCFPYDGLMNLALAFQTFAQLVTWQPGREAEQEEADSGETGKRICIRIELKAEVNEACTVSF